MIKLPASYLIKKKQIIYVTGVLLLSVLVLVGVAVTLKEKHPAKVKEEKPINIDFATPLDNVDTQSVWKEHIQRRLKQLEVDHGTTSKAQQTEAQKQEAINNKLAVELTAYQEKYEALQKEIEEIKQAKGINADNKSTSMTSGNLLPPAPGQENARYVAAQSELVHDDKIKSDQIKLKSKSEEIEAHKNPSNYVAAGSYATAVLLGGADASAGAMSQTNPKPILLKIVSPGTLPNDKQSHLKGCMVTAAVIGDISAERGNIRLERLSCTKPSGQIIDLSVKGTLFGHDGKNGVRGHPVWREGPLIARAGVAGLFQGLGQGVEAKYTPQAALLSTSNQFPSDKQLIGRSAGSGLNSAFDKIADYNIKRAEQYHPIIQISAGQLVDVVFLGGFYIDGVQHEEEFETKESVEQLEEKDNGSRHEARRVLAELSEENN